MAPTTVYDKMSKVFELRIKILSEILRQKSFLIYKSKYSLC
jgi:hypothetical protein